MTHFKVMTVKDLKELIAGLPDDMEVIYDECSDYSLMYVDQVSVEKAVLKYSTGYVMRSHSTMSDENKALEKEYLHFPGN